MKAQSEEHPAIDGSGLRTLQAYRSGVTLTELSEGIRHVTEAAQLTGKPGKVTLVIDVVSSGNAVAITADVTVKVPKLKKPAAIFFVDDQHNLVRDDPEQTQLKLRTVEDAGQQQAEPLRKAVDQ